VAAGHGYEISNGGALGGGILERQHETDKTEDARNPGLPGASKYGDTQTIDGATIQIHPLLNVVLLCASFSVIMPVAVSDASQHHDNETAAAEGKMDIREARIINEAIYVGVIAAS
jgi:hypothetical protein